MPGFVGRHNELAILDTRLRCVEESHSGVAVTIRGRRQVGKSRLVQEFCGRADNLTPAPLNSAEVAEATGLDAAQALDAHLITGGLPGVLRSRPGGMAPMEFLERECADPAAPLFSVPGSAWLAEFPALDQTRRVLGR